jgi:hypothetical protein
VYNKVPMSRVARTSFLYFLHLRSFFFVPNSDFLWQSADGADLTPAEET